MYNHRFSNIVLRSVTKVLRNKPTQVVPLLAAVMLFLLVPSSQPNAALCGLREYLPAGTEFEATFLDPEQIKSFSITIREKLELGPISLSVVKIEDVVKLTKDYICEVKLSQDLDGMIVFVQDGELMLEKIENAGEDEMRSSYVLEHKNGRRFPVTVPQGQSVVLLLKSQTKLSVDTTSRVNAWQDNLKRKSEYSKPMTINVSLLPGTAEVAIPNGSQLKLQTQDGGCFRKAAGLADRTAIEIDGPARAAEGQQIILNLRNLKGQLTQETLQVCFRGHDSQDIGKPYIMSPEVEVLRPNSSETMLKVTIPEFPDGLPDFHWDRLDTWLQFGAAPVQIKVIAFDKDKKTITMEATKDFAISRAWLAMLIGTAALAFGYLLPIVIFRRFTTNNEPVFEFNPIWLAIGRSGKASLSLFQIWLWTLLVFSSAAYVLTISGQLIKITNEVLILLGISGAASLAAKLTAISREERGIAIVARLNGSSVVKEAPEWVDLISTGGRFDAFKFQMLLFTGLTALFVLFSVLVDLKFPEIPESFLWLMGISNGVYLGGKLASTNVFSDIENIDRRLQATKARLAIDKAKSEKSKLELTSIVEDSESKLKIKRAELTRLEKSIETEQDPEKVRFLEKRREELIGSTSQIRGNMRATSEKMNQLKSRYVIEEPEETIEKLEEDFKAAKAKIKKLIKNDPTDPV